MMWHLVAWALRWLYLTNLLARRTVCHQLISKPSQHPLRQVAPRAGPLEYLYLAIVIYKAQPAVNAVPDHKLLYVPQRTPEPLKVGLEFRLDLLQLDVSHIPLDDPVEAAIVVDRGVVVRRLREEELRVCSRPLRSAFGRELDECVLRDGRACADDIDLRPVRGGTRASGDGRRAPRTCSGSDVETRQLVGKGFLCVGRGGSLPGRLGQTSIHL